MAKKKSNLKEEVKEVLEAAQEAIESVVNESEDITEEQVQEAKEVTPMSDKELIEMLKQNAEAERNKIIHRELGMAYDGLIKSLSEVDSWLKTIEDVSKELQK
ncbi:MAG: hypothetical protein AB7I27_00430 [Bacteriovoracaceae bacterium]